MAPKGGRGGGGRGGGGAATCPDAFASTIQQVYFANDVVFLAVFLGIALALCSIRKKSGPGKKLIGIPYILAVFFTTLVYACSVVATVLQECDVGDPRSVYDWNIAINIFFFISYWLILFVLVYTLGAMLHQQSGKFTTPFKIMYLVVMGFMAIITISLMGIIAYNSWTMTRSGRFSDHIALFDVATKFRVAYYVLYMLCILFAGALALITVVSLRSKRNPAGDLIGWVAALFFVTLVWVVFNVSTAAIVLSNDEAFTFISASVLLWLGSFFQALTYIFLLCIAKHQCWSRPSAVDHNNMAPNPYIPPTQQQQQYAYNGQTNGQPYYYQAAPKHDAPELAR